MNERVTLNPYSNQPKDEPTTTKTTTSQTSERRRARYKAQRNEFADFVPMARDVEIVRKVHQYRMMTTDQIAVLFFSQGAISNCRARLTKLYHAGYLERFPMYAGAGLMAGQAIYRLDELGARMLAQEQEITLKEFKYWGKGDSQDRRMTQRTPNFLDHELKINTFRVAVELAAQQLGYEVLMWHYNDDVHLGKVTIETINPTTGEVAQDEHGLIPDSFFVVGRGDVAGNFFLELDNHVRNKQEVARWRMKARAYRAYTKPDQSDPQKRSLYERRYQTKSLRILAVSAGNHEHLMNLRTATEQEGGKGRFWFATFKDVQSFSTFESKADAENNNNKKPTILDAPIWWRARSDEEQKVADVALPLF